MALCTGPPDGSAATGGEAFLGWGCPAGFGEHRRLEFTGLGDGPTLEAGGASPAEERLAARPLAMMPWAQRKAPRPLWAPLEMVAVGPWMASSSPRMPVAWWCTLVVKAAGLATASPHCAMPSMKLTVLCTLPQAVPTTIALSAVRASRGRPSTAATISAASGSMRRACAGETHAGRGGRASPASTVTALRITTGIMPDLRRGRR
jgi:hypothetical protein